MEEDEAKDKDEDKERKEVERLRASGGVRLTPRWWGRLRSLPAITCTYVAERLSISEMSY